MKDALDSADDDVDDDLSNEVLNASLVIDVYCFPSPSSSCTLPMDFHLLFVHWGLCAVVLRAGSSGE